MRHATSPRPCYEPGKKADIIISNNPDQQRIRAYLVGGLEHFFYFPYIGNFIIPNDEVIFFSGVGIPPDIKPLGGFQDFRFSISKTGDVDFFEDPTDLAGSSALLETVDGRTPAG